MSEKPEHSISFDRAADFYDRTRGFPPGHELPAARLFVEAGRLDAGSRVLEIGIGTGRIAAPLAAQFDGAYYGIDISAAMLARLHTKPGSEKIRASQGDATQMPFPDSTFDAIVAVHVFHLIPNWQDALREAARLLKPHGLLLHAMGQQIAAASLSDVWNEAISKNGFSARAPIPPGKRPDFLQEAGWIEQIEPLTYSYVSHQSPNEFLNSIRSRHWSITWQMDDETFETGVKAVEDYIAAHYRDPDAPETIEQMFTVRAFRPPEMS